MRKLGVVIFGASVFDHHPNLDNPRFLRSAREFQKLFRENVVLADRRPRLLDLFDKPFSPSETIIKITDFVSSNLDTIVVYYCGHGDAPRDREYRVFLRKSQRKRRSGTLLDIPGLILDIERISAQKQIFFVLDACFSGDVIRQMSEFMDAGGIDAIADRALQESLSHSGIAIPAATRGLDPALAKERDETTLFTGAIMSCIYDGIDLLRSQPTLSWNDIRDYVARTTRERLGSEAPVPKIISLDDRHGDITRIPFFYNKAYAPMVEEEPSATIDSKVELLYWLDIKDRKDPCDFGLFLRKFPSGVYVPLARRRIRDLISNETNPEAIEQFEHDYRDIADIASCESRLAALRWRALNQPTTGDSVDYIEKLRAFVERFEGTLEMRGRSVAPS
jgi:hypothetical protein